MASLATPTATARNARSLVFVGFMGAGKSKAARAIARAAGMQAIDTDSLLEAELGSSIAEFFEREGEAEFRRREEELVCRVLSNARGAPIALGGGSVTSPRVREALGDHATVWLEVGLDDAWGRVERSRRPLARDRARFDALHAERTPLYEEVSDAVMPARREVVSHAVDSLLALRELPPGTRLAWGHSSSGEYPAFVGPGLLASAYWPLAGKRFLVTDTLVGELYAKQLGEVAGEVSVAPGEQSKTLSETERVLRELATLGMTRADHIVALGGGVVGDLAGFCAATYQRGVGVVQVPTSLVGQVDSAYGGKTGVDLPEAKNYVGAYHLPRAVIADTATLSTLPPGELAAGFVEVVKTALIAGGALWERVRAIETIEPRGLDDVIFACARTKLEIVASDERDAGRRALLNLGHTVGHAIESASAYQRYRHGEAVGLGLLAALRLSGAPQLRDEVADLLARHGLPVRIDESIDVETVLAAISRDKKRTAQGVGFVLCERPGNAVTARSVKPDRVREAVEELYGER